MHALISPHSATALVFDQRGAFVLDNGQTSPAPLSAASAWLAAHEQLQWFSNDSVTALNLRLALQSRRQEALDLALISLDDDLSAELRDEAQAELEILLAEAQIEGWLASLFHARPLPTATDTALALQQARRAQRRRVLAWLVPVIDHQALIAEAWAAWNAIPDGLLVACGGRQALLDRGLECGLFGNVLALLAQGKTGTAKFEAVRLLNGIVNYRAIADAWLAPLIQTDAAPRVLQREEPEEDERLAAPKKEKPRSYDRKQALRKVNEFKTRIIGLMQSRRWERIGAVLDELLDYQQRYGGVEFAAKSLCDLAMEAKKLGHSRWQLDLTTRAIQLCPADGWSWAQHGDALLAHGQLEAALQAYDNSIDFGAYEVGQCGRAEVLKTCNRLPEALAAYEDAIKDHAENVVAKNGRAEVLKASNRLPEALAAYEDAIKDHAENVVAKNGRAEVLKASNRLPEALAAYEEIIKDHPQDVVAKNGRAELLKACNRLPEALAAYEEVIKDHPEDLVARNGCASLLLLQGEYARALALLPNENPEHIEDWIGWHIRAMVLLRQGALKDAIAALEWGVKAGPPPPQKDYFRAALAMALLWQEDWEQAQAQLALVAHPGLQCVGNFHLHAHQNDRQGMEQSIAELTSHRPSTQVQELTEEWRLRYLNKQPGRHSDQWLREREVDCLALFTIILPSQDRMVLLLPSAGKPVQANGLS